MGLAPLMISAWFHFWFIHRSTRFLKNPNKLWREMTDFFPFWDFIPTSIDDWYGWKIIRKSILFNVTLLTESLNLHVEQLKYDPHCQKHILRKVEMKPHRKPQFSTYEYVSQQIEITVCMNTICRITKAATLRSTIKQKCSFGVQGCLSQRGFYW